MSEAVLDITNGKVLDEVGGAKWPVYPAYKDSGVEWLGEVPAHWEVRRLKYISKIQNSNVDKKAKDGEIPVRLCNYVDVYNNDFITSDIKFMSATATIEEIRRFELKRDDVLITKDSESWDDIAVPAYVVRDVGETVCGYHLTQIRPAPSESYGEYLFRCFSASGINEQFAVSANGVTRFGLSKNVIGCTFFTVPPLPEQRAIATFLNRETVRIDTLIAKKKRLIELLQEKRTALISQAVTKGLDPNVPMTDSGVEWLGEIPAHWDIAHLKRKFSVRLGKMLQSEPRGEDDTLEKYLRAANIQWNGADLSDIKEMWFSPSEKKKFKLERGDLLVSEGGT